jgi:ArsR family transcriptional regulator, arsenate/arsenite/antimonite-responsive transcriptional repressor
MTIKLRPIDCCAVPTHTEPLPDGEREALVAVFRALGDPTRLEIFRLIAAQADPICVCDVVDRFDVSQPTISHHLRVLREAVWAYYAPNPQGLERLHQVGSSLKLAEVTAVG